MSVGAEEKLRRDARYGSLTLGECMPYSLRADVLPG